MSEWQARADCNCKKEAFVEWNGKRMKEKVVGKSNEAANGFKLITGGCCREQRVCVILRSSNKKKFVCYLCWVNVLLDVRPFHCLSEAKNTSAEIRYNVGSLHFYHEESSSSTCVKCFTHSTPVPLLG